MFMGQFLKGSNMGPLKKFNHGKLRNYFAFVLSNNYFVLKSIQKFDSHLKFS